MKPSDVPERFEFCTRCGGRVEPYEANDWNGPATEAIPAETSAARLCSTYFCARCQRHWGAFSRDDTGGTLVCGHFVPMYAKFCPACGVAGQPEPLSSLDIFRLPLAEQSALAGPPTREPSTHPIRINLGELISGSKLPQELKASLLEAFPPKRSWADWKEYTRWALTDFQNMADVTDDEFVEASRIADAVFEALPETDDSPTKQPQRRTVTPSL